MLFAFVLFIFGGITSWLWFNSSFRIFCVFVHWSITVYDAVSFKRCVGTHLTEFYLSCFLHKRRWFAVSSCRASKRIETALSLFNQVVTQHSTKSNKENKSALSSYGPTLILVISIQHCETTCAIMYVPVHSLTVPGNWSLPRKQTNKMIAWTSSTIVMIKLTSLQNCLYKAFCWHW